MQCPVEDRIAIQDLMITYAHAVDTIGNIDGILEVFTEDAVFDLSGIGLAALEGHDGIRAFFTNVFANMAHHAHYLTNFAVTAYDGDTASMRAYVIGMGQGKDGSTVTVNGRYYFDVRRTEAGWKATRYTMDFLMPLSGTLENAR
ncbi:nuclear transport factor 2 family protein [Novosphingobium taihuense]|uniref:Ketosteroid isomerase-like protein n=1 Tax=Novosphingobium taihuense TaxID=260085 RepID=A0A7W7ADC3_9SPHN|nr:nuclear transport factor 2 family protein [Novosphingobium taihuense]MBB4614933.1 ketosteroid isomerase-like protein [Novosphingobium taihuense]TWH84626.1 ketosteroid isomerase-like protein [Novosphingobium taihuense]